jgi:hypothetical protein
MRIKGILEFKNGDKLEVYSFIKGQMGKRHDKFKR